MNNYLVTYEDALEMVKEFKNFNYSMKEREIRGYKVVTFEYFLCNYEKFINPLIKRPEVHGLDMRGVTFVFNKDGSLFKRFFMLKKFFNLDQVESTQYYLIKDKKIRSVTDKADGSLVAFMYLPDESIFCKTIAGFDNDQSIAGMDIFEKDTNINFTVKALLFAGYTPLFEYVSYNNRIVLKYNKADLILIGYRNNNTGQYIPGYRENNFECSVTEYFTDVTLDELIEKAKVEEDKEGWVVEFDDTEMIKIKTEWYFNLHGIRTENVFREDWVIQNYLDGKLDDILAQLDNEVDFDAIKFIDRCVFAVDAYMQIINNAVESFINKYENEFKSKWHYFAKFNCREPFFGLAVYAIQEPEKYNKRKAVFIKNKTKKLKLARLFVDEWAGDLNNDIKKWEG